MLSVQQALHSFYGLFGLSATPTPSQSWSVAFPCIIVGCDQFGYVLWFDFCYLFSFFFHLLFYLIRLFLFIILIILCHSFLFFVSSQHSCFPSDVILFTCGSEIWSLTSLRHATFRLFLDYWYLLNASFMSRISWIPAVILICIVTLSHYVGPSNFSPTIHLLLWLTSMLTCTLFH